MAEKDAPKTLTIAASIATILGTCIACIALVPAFGQWLNPGAPVSAPVQTQVQIPAVTQDVNSTRPVDNTSPSPAVASIEPPTLPLPTETLTAALLPPSSTPQVSTSTPRPTATPTTSLLPLIKGYFEVSVESVEARKHTPQAFNFEKGISLAPAAGPDVVFASCSLDVADRQYCTISANRVWYVGQVPIDDVFDTQNGENIDLQYAPIQFGSTYVVSTLNGHLAKFRVTWVDRNNPAYPSFKFGLNWVYQPNPRSDFAGPPSSALTGTPQQGFFEVAIAPNEDGQHPPQALSFEQGQMNPNGIPADIVFADCSLDVGDLQYCGVGANAIWYQGDNMPLDTNFESRGSLFQDSRYVYLKPGAVYIVETFNGHLAKFRVTYVNRSDPAYPAFKFGLNWIYQP